MEFILVLLIITVVGSTLVTVRERSKITRALTNPVQPMKELMDTPKTAHRLTRTWIVSTRDGNIPAGWRWRCHCGVWGVATNAYQTPTDAHLGSEAAAIEGYKVHAKSYHEVSVDRYKEQFEAVTAEFAEYRQKCYCKESNDDLLKWRN